MSSKSDILDSINRQQLQAVDLPELDHSWIVYEDRRQQFAEVLQTVGGTCIAVRDFEELNLRLSELPSYTSAKKVATVVPDAGTPTLDLEAVDDPHDLEDVDYAILHGQFAVAENGAVWITDEDLRHRVLYFLAQHLALVVPGDAIVDNMHQAYQRLSSVDSNRWAPGRGTGFGAFVSGPSKTADIEQSLVIGAHGARSLTVFLVDSLGTGNTTPQTFQ